jgi:hypothetical protein
MGLTSGQVMDEAALLLNDSAKTTFTYAVLAPWFKKAIDHLSDELAVNSIPLLKRFSTVTTVAISGTTIALPADTLIPVKLEERESGATTPYLDMVPVDDLPEGVSQAGSLNYWAFRGTLLNSVPVIDIIGSTTARQVRITYDRFLPQIPGSVGTEDYTTSLTWNTKRFLGAKTAEYVSRFVLKDDKRSKELREETGISMDRLIKIWIRKSPAVRRRGYSRF